MRQLTLPLVVLIPLFTASGCHDDPPSAAEVRKHISDDLGNVLRETKAAVDGTTLPSGSTLDILSTAWNNNSTLSGGLEFTICP